MKLLVIFGLCLLLSGCSRDGNYNRGYVISHSQVEESDVHQEASE